MTIILRTNSSDVAIARVLVNVDKDETDHRNLIWMDHSSDPKVQRMNLAMSEFNYTLLHIPRTLNEVSDWFSKYCIKTISYTEKVFKNAILSDLTVEEALSQVHNAIVGHHEV